MMRTITSLALAASWLALAGSAQAAPPAWAPASSATIHPGIQMYTDGGQCTANFVFYDASDVYIGYAAHCAEVSEGAVGSPNTNCDAESVPLGTAVELGRSGSGTLAYSSYFTMAERQESDSSVCQYNDFAVVRVDPEHRDKVNPSMPFWGGPTGLRQSTMKPYEKVLSFGNSGLRAGIEQLSPKEGYTLGENDGSMSHELWTATPGIFGDSGSGYIDGSGSAFGIASTISALTTNNASDLAFGLDYMHRYTDLRLRLALGTEKFSGPLAGQGIAASPEPEPQPGNEPSSSGEPTAPPASGGGNQSGGQPNQGGGGQPDPGSGGQSGGNAPQGGGEPQPSSKPSKAKAKKKKAKKKSCKRKKSKKARKRCKKKQARKKR